MTRLLITLALLLGINLIAEVGQDVFQVSVQNVAAVDQVEDSDEAFILSHNIARSATWINWIRYISCFLLIIALWQKPLKKTVIKIKDDIKSS